MKQLLHLDGDQRISPHQALQHPFITMSHLTKHPDSRAYLTSSWTRMNVVPVEDSANRRSTSAAGKESSDRFSCDEAPTRSFDGVSYDDVPATRSSDGVPLAHTYDEDPSAWSSDGGLPACFSDEDESSDRVKLTDSTPPASSCSSGGTKHLLRKISRLFSGITAFCCCWCPTVED